jgi:YHS domain-containing protein
MLVQARWPPSRGQEAAACGIALPSGFVMKMLVNLLRFLFVILFLRLLFRFVGGLFRGYRQAEPRGRAPAAGIPLVRDRVCNTFLPSERALRAVIAGREEYFCSPACRDRALAEASTSQSTAKGRTLPPSAPS